MCMPELSSVTQMAVQESNLCPMVELPLAQHALRNALFGSLDSSMKKPDKRMGLAQILTQEFAYVWLL